MSISRYIVPISDVEELIAELLSVEFKLEENISSALANSAASHFEGLKDDCFLLAETPYVDKVYRDSYYHYYSSKLVRYSRNCIRLSIFEGEIKDEYFRSLEKIETLKGAYRGFVILRPTEPKIIGRSLISPAALKNNDIVCCGVDINATVNSIKLKVKGFPHSSQDTETISCAETTLWALMEYFGSKYPEYTPVLPSKIINTLKVSYERQIPSQGLTVQQMSFALKEFGFGTRIYSRAFYDKDFDRIIATYVESGIPILVALQSKNYGIGHAVLCIGRENITDSNIEGLLENQFEDQKILERVTKRQLKIFDLDNLNLGYIFIDDNFPAYQHALLQKPAEYYRNGQWADCQITHIVVPLYPKIYLEAFQAKSYLYRFLLSNFIALETHEEVLIRFYLASSRSYKNSLSSNSEFEPNLKEIVLETEMPKFIWVAELSSKVLIKQKKATGLIILDATEANLNYNYPLILAYYKDKLIVPNLDTNTLEKKDVPSTSFSIFEGNLNNYMQ